MPYVVQQSASLFQEDALRRPLASVRFQGRVRSLRKSWHFRSSLLGSDFACLLIVPVGGQQTVLRRLGASGEGERKIFDVLGFRNNFKAMMLILTCEI